MKCLKPTTEDLTPFTLHDRIPDMPNPLITIRESKRAKNMSLVVHWGGKCEVVIPFKNKPSPRRIQMFIESQTAWIDRHMNSLKTNKLKTPLVHQGRSRKDVTEGTQNLVEHILKKHNLRKTDKIEQIRFRNYKAQWGSCSSGGNLNFHYKLSLLPEHLAEYIIIHEICHMYHFNHSKTFWQAVSILCPDYKTCRKALKQYLI